MKTRCFIGLGSNLQSPVLQVQTALENLKKISQSHFLAASSLYQTKPVGVIDQPDFINAVALLETTLSAQDLLHALQNIEHLQGRIREKYWGPRTLDLDLLLYGDLQLYTPELTIPHPRLSQRAFVLRPLLDLAPDLVLPNGEKVQVLYDKLSVNEKGAVVLYTQI